MDLVREDSLWRNVALWSAVFGWFSAQFIKFAVHYARTRQRDFGYFVSTGGMPSAHSCLVSALATAVGIESGIGSPVFAATTIFAMIVMFDAQSVRRAAGLQARVVNQIVDELMIRHHLPGREKLAELLGHTRHEVFAGMSLGILVAFATHAIWQRF
jgi:acid phosphatase family membrane protein YuiD